MAMSVSLSSESPEGEIKPNGTFELHSVFFEIGGEDAHSIKIELGEAQSKKTIGGHLLQSKDGHVFFPEKPIRLLFPRGEVKIKAALKSTPLRSFEIQVNFK